MATRALNLATRCVGTAIIALFMPLGYAQESLQFAVDAGLGYTDNILRVPEGERGEAIASLGTQLSIQHESRRLTADVLADLAYFSYRDDTYDNELTGNVIATSAFGVIPERFEWVVEDNFGQAQRDPFLAVTPENRENVNLFATGPDFTARLGPELDGRLAARYMRVDFEESPTSSERYSALLSVSHTLASAAKISAHVGTEKVTPEEASGSAEYDLQELFGRYALDGARTRLSIDAGVTQLKRDDFSDDGVLLRLDVMRRIGDRSSVNFSVGHEYSDSGESLRFMQGISGVDTDARSLAVTPEPFVSEFANLGWDASGRATRIGASLAYVDEAYPQQAALDRSQVLADVRLARDLGPLLTCGVGVNHLREDYRNIPGDASELTFSAQLTWRLGRQLFLSLLLEHTDRDSELATAEFAENRALLRVRFGDVVTRRRPNADSAAPQ